MNPAQHCPSCKELLHIERLRCGQCGTVVEGSFLWPRLARLSPEDQKLIELFLLSSGSLKAVAKKLDISYPTLRKRLDDLIKEFEAHVKKDEKLRHQLIKDLATGKKSVLDVMKKLES